MVIGIRTGLLLLATALALGAPRPCGAVEFLAATGSGFVESTLYTIDSDDGTATEIGPIGFVGVSGMDFDSMGTLYATGFRIDDSVHVLITIDPMTGAGTEVGPTDIELVGEFNAADLSFRPSDGALFAYLEDDDQLGTIDTTTGTITSVGFTDSNGCCGNGMAFVGSTLYHANDVDLSTLDQATGVEADEIPLVFGDLGFARVAAMDASPGGTLVGILKTGSGSSSESHLVAIGKESGNVRVLAQTRNGLDAFAIPPGVDFDVDADPPTCDLDTTDLTGSQVQFTIQDTGSGLASIEALTDTNANCSVPPFSVGTTDAVVVTCDGVTAHEVATVQLRATDVGGNAHDCEETSFNIELEPPFCFAYQSSIGPPTQVTFAAGDLGSGLALVGTSIFINVQTTVDFPIGTNETIFIPFTAVDPTLTSAVQLVLHDVDGNQRVCQPMTFQGLSLEKNGSLRRSLTNVTNQQPILTVKNDDPGFTRLKVVLGRFRQTIQLAPAEVVELNLSSALAPGNNTITLQAWGKAGAALAVFAASSNAP